MRMLELTRGRSLQVKTLQDSANRSPAIQLIRYHTNMVNLFESDFYGFVNMFTIIVYLFNVCLLKLGRRRMFMCVYKCLKPV